MQISNTEDRVLSLFVRARAGNTGNVYFGVSDVSSTNGLELAPGESQTTSFNTPNQPGSVQFKTFYLDTATNGNDVDWTVILA